MRTSGESAILPVIWNWHYLVCQEDLNATKWTIFQECPAHLMMSLAHSRTAEHLGVFLTQSILQLGLSSLSSLFFCSASVPEGFWDHHERKLITTWSLEVNFHLRALWPITTVLLNCTVMRKMWEKMQLKKRWIFYPDTPNHYVDVSIDWFISSLALFPVSKLWSNFWSSRMSSETFPLDAASSAQVSACCFLHKNRRTEEKH